MEFDFRSAPEHRSLEPIERGTSFGWSNAPSNLDPAVSSIVYGPGSGLSHTMPSINRGGTPPMPLKPVHGVASKTPRSKTARPRPRTQSGIRVHMRRSGLATSRLATHHDKRMEKRSSYAVNPELTKEQNQLLSIYQEKAAESENLKIELEVLNRMHLAEKDKEEPFEVPKYDSGTSQSLVEEHEKLREHAKQLLDQNEKLELDMDAAKRLDRERQQQLQEMQVKLDAIEHEHKYCDVDKAKLNLEKQDLKERLDELRDADEKFKAEKKWLIEQSAQHEENAVEFEQQLSIKLKECKQMEQRWKIAKKKLKDKIKENQSLELVLAEQTDTINGLKQDLIKCKDEEQRLQREIRATKTEFREASARIITLENELGLALNDVKKTKEKLNLAKDELAETQENFSVAMNEKLEQINGLETHNADLTSRLETAEANWAKFEAQAKELTELNLDLSNKLEVMRNQKEDLETTLIAKSNHIKSLQDKIPDLEAERDKMRKDLTATERKFESKKRQHAKVVGENKKYAKEVHQLNATLRELEEIQRYTVRQMERLKKASANSLETIAAMEVQYDRQKGVLNEHRQQIVQLTNQVGFLQESNDDYEKNVARLTQLHKSAISRVASDEATIRALQARVQELTVIKTERDQLRLQIKQKDQMYTQLKNDSARDHEDVKRFQLLKIESDALIKKQTEEMETMDRRLEQEKDSVISLSKMVKTRDGELVKMKADYQELRIKSIKLKTAVREAHKSAAGDGKVSMDPEVTAAIEGPMIANLKYELKSKTLQVKNLQTQLLTVQKSSRASVRLGEDMVGARESRWQADKYKYKLEMGKLKERVIELRAMVEDGRNELNHKTDQMKALKSDFEQTRVQLNLMTLKKSAIWDKRTEEQDSLVTKTSEELHTAKALHEQKEEELQNLKHWNVHIMAIHSVLAKKLKHNGDTPITKEQFVELIEKDNDFFKRLTVMPSHVNAVPDPNAESHEVEKLHTAMGLAKKEEKLARDQLSELRLENIKLTKQLEKAHDQIHFSTESSNSEKERQAAILEASHRYRQMKASIGVVWEAPGINPRGLIVKAVLPDSSGEEVGLEIGDVVIEVNTFKVKNKSDYRDALLPVRPGDTILFVFQRQGEHHRALLRMGAEGYTLDQAQATLRLVRHSNTDIKMDFTDSVEAQKLKDQRKKKV